MRLRFLYTAILVLCLSGLATSAGDCAGHTGPVVTAARAAVGAVSPCGAKDLTAPADKPLATEKETTQEFPGFLLTLYI